MSVKLGLSVTLVAVGFIVGYWQGQVGQSANMWLVPVLGCFMVFAMWLFPEAGKKDGDKR